MKRITNIKWICFLLLFAVALQYSCEKNKDLNDSGNTNPQIANYYPNSGNAGTLVTIVGSGFGKDRIGTQATFNGIEADVIEVTEEKIVVRAPEKGTDGLLRLQLGDHALEVGEYTYQSLSVQRITPERAQANAEIHIIGEGFESKSGVPVVTINGIEAVIVQSAAQELVVRVPEDVGSGPVVVKLGEMVSTGPSLIYMSVQSIKPLTGGAGTRVTIEGEGFAEGINGNEVAFNGVFAEVLEASSTQLVVRAPVDVATGDVIVKLAEGNINGPTFTVVPPPALDIVSPLSGPSGMEMTISGNYFSENEGETYVYIGGKALTHSSVSSKEIKLILPADVPSGNVKVVVNDQVTEGPAFKSQNLGITNLSRDNGLAGTRVTITGVGFSAIAAENDVLFDGIAGQVISATENSITATAPTGLRTGKIQVSTGGLSALSPVDFRRAGVETVVRGVDHGFTFPTSTSVMAVDGQGNLYFGVMTTKAIYKLTPQGSLSVFAGSGTGEAGDADGIGTAARININGLIGLVFNPVTQKLYFMDNTNRTVRSISLSGQVQTIYTGFSSAVHQVTVAADGKLYFSQQSNRAIVGLNPVTLETTTIYGPSNSTNTGERFFGYDGNMYYPSGSYIAQYTNLTTNPPTVSSYWIRLSKQANASCAIDYENLLSFSTYSYGILQSNLREQSAKEIFSWTGGTGFADGDGLTAKFGAVVNDMVAGPDGLVYVLDNSNNAIRKVYTR
ncbi:IPT/TIG domain-containing protein [Sphingobacterium sp. LRF_L2]|uniref:IPT/TIG domain-containing protein n=1 Tax=Sphingobacterium sp. LRF_L2 TaxID=3369421 RepID=UPI003F6082F2